MHNLLKLLLTIKNQMLSRQKPHKRLVKEKAIILVLVLASFNTLSQETEQDWWFNVEIIVFKRDLLPTNTEDFSQDGVNLTDTKSNQLLVLRTLQQQHVINKYYEQLPLCDGAQKEFELPIEFDLTDIPAMSNYKWWTVEYPLDTTLTDEYYKQLSNSVQQEQNNLENLLNTLDSESSEKPDSSLSQTGLNDNLEGNRAQVNVFQYISPLSFDLVNSQEYQQFIPAIVDSFKKQANQSLKDYLTQIIEGFDTEITNTKLENIAVAPVFIDADNLPAIVNNEVLNMNNAVEALNLQIENLQHAISETLDTSARLTNLSCRNSLLTVNFPKAIDERVFASYPYFKNSIHLVDETELAMAEFAQQLFRQRDIQPLLYASYRDNIVFGIENAPYIRLVAGELLTANRSDDRISYDEWLEQYKLNQALRGISSQDNMRSEVNISAQTNFFEELEMAIKENKPVDWLKLEDANKEDLTQSNNLQQAFEIDGSFKVYLEYVNQVPYLHIDSELNHAKLEIDATGESSLKMYPFKQRRRIISKQIHYFDHPAFGMVVRLERFVPPVSINEDSDKISTNNQ